jgi:hypothetical protein
VVVNETLARRFFPGQDPIGRRIRVQLFQPELAADDPRQWREVVGIVRDMRHYGRARPLEPELYFPYQGRMANVRGSDGTRSGYLLQPPAGLDRILPSAVGKQQESPWTSARTWRAPDC